MSKDFLDDLLGSGDGFDAKAWQQRSEERKKGGGGQSFVSSFYLKPNEVGVVNFLNNGVLLNLYTVQDFVRGTKIYRDVLAYDGDPLAASGLKASEKSVYAVVDWLHSWEKDGKIIKKPQVKVLVRGQNTALHFERARQKTPTKSLHGYKWTLERMGSGTSTVYMPEMEEEMIPDFDAVVTVNGKDGPFETSLIGRPDWPEYDGDDVPVAKQSLYTRRGARPDHDIDWNNPDHVAKWLKCYFASVPLTEYERLASGGKRQNTSTADASKEIVDFTQQAVKASKKAEPVKKVESEEDNSVYDDDIPF